jgi:hypothetical protein
MGYRHHGHHKTPPKRLHFSDNDTAKCGLKVRFTIHNFLIELPEDGAEILTCNKCRKHFGLKPVKWNGFDFISI